jgi:Transposase, Mutator family
MLETCGPVGKGLYLPGDRVEVSSKIGAATPVGKVQPDAHRSPDDWPGQRGGKDAPRLLIDEIVREGARRMLAEALQAEVDAYIAQFADQRGEDGRRLVVRNGYHQPRTVLTSAGAVEVTVPRVNDKRTDLATGERRRFSSAILPPWARKTPKITEVLPLLCLLVMLGVRADGRKELIALADEYRESAESWADLLRDCARRGMRAPVLAIGDGALGLWNALREVFPETREGRCWFHKTANVLAALPKSAHPGAKKALAEIWGAEDKDHALRHRKAQEQDHQRARLPGGGLAMAFKLIESAQARWRCVNAPHLVALVRAGATFVNGKLVERPGESTQPEAA